MKKVLFSRLALFYLLLHFISAISWNVYIDGSTQESLSAHGSSLLFFNVTYSCYQ